MTRKLIRASVELGVAQRLATTDHRRRLQRSRRLGCEKLLYRGLTYIWKHELRESLVPQDTQASNRVEASPELEALLAEKPIALGAFNLFGASPATTLERRGRSRGRRRRGFWAHEAGSVQIPARIVALLRGGREAEDLELESQACRLEDALNRSQLLRRARVAGCERLYYRVDSLRLFDTLAPAASAISRNAVAGSTVVPNKRYSPRYDGKLEPILDSKLELTVLKCCRVDPFAEQRMTGG